MRALVLWYCVPLLLLMAACNDINRVEGKRAPNIIVILADDLKWNAIGCFGQEKISTPNIDRIAYEGMRFTRAYSGSSVCAPSRSCLMEGKHTGHARVRGNSYKEYRESLRPGDITIAMLLQKAGYATGLFGKWGLAVHDQPGLPTNMGFDSFAGYLNQRHAHNFYPQFLYQNTEKIYFPENGDHYKDPEYLVVQNPYDHDGRCMPLGIADPSKATYAFDFYCEKSLEFIQNNKDVPFFLFLAYTIPHGQPIVPDLGAYQSKDWPLGAKERAAMITRMDDEVGKVMSMIKQYGLDEHTIIFFASDNGNPDYDSDSIRDSTYSFDEFFNIAPPTRGQKGQLFDGSVHVPAMVRWPGHIKPHQVSDQEWAFWDFMPTACQLAGIEAPADIDGLSIVPTLLGIGTQEQHQYLYWEKGSEQAVKTGHWFAHRMNGRDLSLFDLAADPGQTIDLSGQHAEIAERMHRIMEEAHTPGDVWPSPGETPQAFQKRLREHGVPERPDNIGLF